MTPRIIIGTTSFRKIRENNFYYVDKTSFLADFLNGEGGLIDWRGIVLVVLSGLCYTLFIIIVNQSKEVKALPNLTLTFYCFLVGTVVLFFFTKCGVELNRMSDASCWLNVIGLAILPTALATITLASATKRIGATKTSVMGILEPLTAIFVGVAVFQEPFTMDVAIGVILILFPFILLPLFLLPPAQSSRFPGPPSLHPSRPRHAPIRPFPQAAAPACRR